MPTHLAASAIDMLAAMHPAGMVLKRPGVGAYVDGRYVDGTPEPDTPIDGTCHAMKPREMEDLPEGLRHDDMRVVHTRTPITAWEEDRPGDMIEYNGRDYKVLRVRERFEGDFHRVVMGHNHVRTNTI